MKKLFVGNLPFSTTEEELEKLFGTIGQVADVNIISDKFTGRSRGFGFVEMVEEADAARAIEELHDHQLGDRAITVQEAQDKKK